MVGLHLDQNPIRFWLHGHRIAAFQFGALFIIGFGTALLSVHYTWGLMVMALPMAVVLVSLRKTVQLISQTIDAV